MVGDNNELQESAVTNNGGWVFGVNTSTTTTTATTATAKMHSELSVMWWRRWRG